MNNDVFGKSMEDLRNHKNIELVTIEERRNYLVSKPYHTSNFFSNNLIAIEIKSHKYL